MFKPDHHSISKFVRIVLNWPRTSAGVSLGSGPKFLYSVASFLCLILTSVTLTCVTYLILKDMFLHFYKMNVNKRKRVRESKNKK